MGGFTSAQLTGFVSRCVQVCWHKMCKYFEIEIREGKFPYMQ